MEKIKKTKWKKDVKVIRNELNEKTLEYTLIDKEYSNVVKEDVLNGLPYEDVSELQQMLYHSFKKIAELEARIQELESKVKGV